MNHVPLTVTGSSFGGYLINAFSLAVLKTICYPLSYSLVLEVGKPHSLRHMTTQSQLASIFYMIYVIWQTMGDLVLIESTECEY